MLLVDSRIKAAPINDMNKNDKLFVHFILVLTEQPKLAIVGSFNHLIKFY